MEDNIVIIALGVSPEIIERGKDVTVTVVFDKEIQNIDEASIYFNNSQLEMISSTKNNNMIQYKLLAKEKGVADIRIETYEEEKHLQLVVINALDRFLVGTKKVLEFGTIEEFKKYRDKIAEEVDGDWSGLVIRFNPCLSRSQLKDEDIYNYNTSSLFENCDIKCPPVIEFLMDDPRGLSFEKLFNNSNIRIINNFGIIYPTQRLSSYWKGDEIIFDGMTSKAWNRLCYNIHKAAYLKFHENLVSSEDFDRLQETMPSYPHNTFAFNIETGTHKRLSIVLNYINLTIVVLYGELFASYNDPENYFKKEYKYSFKTAEEMIKFIEEFDKEKYSSKE